MLASCQRQDFKITHTLQSFNTWRKISRENPNRGRKTPAMCLADWHGRDTLLSAVGKEFFVSPDDLEELMRYLGRAVHFSSIQFSSVTQLCLTLCDPKNCSTPGLPVQHQLPEPTQTHHWVSDAIQPSHPLSSPSPPALNLSQHQGLFKWVSSSHQVAKVLEFQLQHQSFQWTPRTDRL